MGSIPRIISTPVKWAFKKILHGTILRFPGGDSHDPLVCTYCPEMCRFSCPTAVVSGNDAVTPRYKHSLLYKKQKWPEKTPAPTFQDTALWPLYDCTGCGRCTQYCVYQVPVADHLFEARQDYPWIRSEVILKSISEATDPVGDMAYELGDSALADKRRIRHGRRSVAEPKELFFLKMHGEKNRLAWEAVLDFPEKSDLPRILANKKWLLYGSVWLSRRLKENGRIALFIERLRAVGVDVVEPFQGGEDLIDCGGEGAYLYLFPEQARKMAEDFWTRDAHRADGILSLSDRAAEHFRRALSGVVVVGPSDWGGET